MSKLNEIKRWLTVPDAPGVGLEFRPGQILVARFGDKGRGEMDLCLKAPVPSGVIEFSMLNPNVKEPEALATFLSKLFDEAGVKRRTLGLTLPDILARISIANLETAPRSRRELAELLRFKLKKSLPFDVNQVRLTYHGLPGSAGSYLTGVMHEGVVSQYEALLEGIGFHVGSIEVSSLSLMKLWEPVLVEALLPEQDCFFVNVEQSYFTLSLVRNRVEPVLIRTVGNRFPPTGAPSAEPAAAYPTESLLRELTSTYIYYKEKLGGATLARVFYRSLRPDLGDLKPLLEERLEVPAEPFDLHRAVTVGRHLAMEEPLASMAAPAAGVARGKAA